MLAANEENTMLEIVSKGFKSAKEALTGKAELTEENIGHIVLDQKAALSVNTELDLSIVRSVALAQ